MLIFIKIIIHICLFMLQPIKMSTVKMFCPYYCIQQVFALLYLNTDCITTPYSKKGIFS